MADDSDFIVRFKEQTKLLRNLQTRVNEAIGRAEGAIKKMEAGVPKEDIFGAPPKK